MTDPADEVILRLSEVILRLSTALKRLVAILDTASLLVVEDEAEMEAAWLQACETINYTGREEDDG